MAKKSLKPITEKIEGSFLDIHVPKFDWLKVELTHNKVNWIDPKTDDVERVEDNFNIVINLSEKVFSEDKDLSGKIKDICSLSFAPYYWREKSYRYYTSERTGSLEEKKNILNNLLTLLTGYEVEKKNQFDESSQVFKEDAQNRIKLESVDLLMKFHEPTQRFVVLAKDFLGSEKFSLLRKCAEYSSQLALPGEVPTANKFLITTDFFAEDLPNKKLEKKTYFFINPSFYEEIKHNFNYEAKQQQEFLEKQKEVSQEKDLSQYNIENENVFGLKIKFIEDHQCFEFYGKGYFENQGFNGRFSPRGLLPLWALNFIYSKDKSENTYLVNEMIVDKEKIELQEVKGGTKREKNIRIPASEWEKVKLIKENFEKEMALWSRPEKTIKISHCDFSNLNIFERFPAVYFDSKGKSYLSYGSRRTGMFRAIGQSFNPGNSLLYEDDLNASIEPEGKKKRDVKFSISLKTIPISFDEAKFYMNEHPFSEYIMSGTLDLNSRIHGPVDNFNMSHEEKKKVFETIYLYSEIQSQAEKNGQDKPKPKKIKI